MKETMNGHVRFSSVVTFEIPIDEALDIISKRQTKYNPADHGSFAMRNWFASRGVSTNGSESYDHNLDELQTAVGKYLTEQRVEERRMLIGPKEVAVPMEATV